MITLVVLVVLFLLLAIGTPVGFSMAIAGVLGLSLVGGADLIFGILRTTSLSAVQSYELLTIPLFILMAEFVLASGIADDLFKAAAAWFGRPRHGDRCGRRWLRGDLRQQHRVSGSAVVHEPACNDQARVRA